MENKAQQQKGLVFMEFFKIRKTKNSQNILVFINEKTCISISRKYLEKVLSTAQEQQSKSEDVA
jgi:hypothetical protein